MRWIRMSLLTIGIAAPSLSAGSFLTCHGGSHPATDAASPALSMVLATGVMGVLPLRSSSSTSFASWLSMARMRPR